MHSELTCAVHPLTERCARPHARGLICRFLSGLPPSPPPAATPTLAASPAAEITGSFNFCPSSTSKGTHGSPFPPAPPPPRPGCPPPTTRPWSGGGAGGKRGGATAWWASIGCAASGARKISALRCILTRCDSSVTSARTCVFVLFCEGRLLVPCVAPVELYETRPSHRCLVDTSRGGRAGSAATPLLSRNKGEEPRHEVPQNSELNKPKTV